MTCSVELVCIGNELLTGRTANTNATWLAKRMTSLGASVKRVTTVGDDAREIRQAVRSVLARAPDFILTSGGLGPTFDDVTIASVSQAVGLPLRVNKEALNQIRARYREIFSPRRYVLTKFRLKMATFPVGARPLPNPVGTAPGMMLLAGRISVICLPGVPGELRAIVSRHVVPLIRLRTRGEAYLSRTIQVRRIFESELAPLINRVMKQHPEVYVKSHPQGGEGRAMSRISLDFSYRGHNSEKGRRILSEAIAEMTRLLASGARKVT